MIGLFNNNIMDAEFTENTQYGRVVIFSSSSSKINISICEPLNAVGESMMQALLKNIINIVI